MFQQGDVILKRYAGKIEGQKLPHLTLAQGEATGHHHTITEGDCELYERNGKLFLRVLSETATLTHQEHKPITLPKSDYEIGIVREYDPFAEEIRNVQD